MKPSPPTTPNFPVYGLAGTFKGSRWLDFWDAREREQLWYVSLAHGDRVTRRPILVVFTDAKLPPRPSDGEHLAKGPTGIEDAAHCALLGLIHLVFPEDSSGTRSPQFYAEVASLDEKGWTDLEQPEWRDVDTYVAGESQTFRWRALGGGWVAAADMGHVALGIYGCGMELTDHEIQPVTTAADLASSRSAYRSE